MTMKLIIFKTAATVAAITISMPPAAAAAEGWWLEGGPVFRGAMHYQVSGSSYVQTLGLHAATGPLVAPASVGSANQYADRTYDNGYVKLDAGTLDPNAIGGPGQTWNWAYDAASQFNAPSATLSFIKQGDLGYHSSVAGTVSGGGDLRSSGINLLSGFSVYHAKRLTIELGFGFQGLWGQTSSFGTSSYQEQTGRINVTDTYAAASAVDLTYGFPPPRTAPGGYAGTYGGPADGPSAWVGGYPVIGNLPTARASANESVSTAQNNINYRLSTDLYELNLSPRVRYAATKRLCLHVTPTLGLAVVGLNAERTESFYNNTSAGTTQLGSWRDSQNGWQVSFSGGVTAGVDYDLGKGYFVGIFGGYNWVVNPTQVELGPSRVTMDASGYVTGAVFGRRF
jgi:hypothetical protein